MTKTTIIEFAKTIEFINILLKDEYKEQLNEQGYLDYIGFIQEISQIKTYNQQLCIEIQFKALLWQEFFNEWMIYLCQLKNDIKSMKYKHIPLSKKVYMLEDTYLKIQQQYRYTNRIYLMAQEKFKKLQV